MPSLGCIKNNNVLFNKNNNVLINKNNNVLIYMPSLGCIKNNNIKEKMKFLILLSNDDLKGGNFLYPNKKNQILKNKKFFAGKINIISYEDYLEDKYPEYIIENPILEHIFVLLHKEKKYVSYENYNILYMNSKMDELEQIFINLKASKIIIKEKYSNNEIINLSSGAEINIPKLEIGNNIELNNETITNIKRFKEKEFTPNNNVIYNTDSFKDDKIFYYLSQNEEWASIIENRLIKSMSKDKFTYIHYNKNLFNFTIENKLNFLNMNLNYNTSNIDITHIEYEVEYAPLKTKNIKVRGEIEEYYPCDCLKIEKTMVDYSRSCFNDDQYIEYN
jgi:hypothetical protein